MQTLISGSLIGTQKSVNEQIDGLQQRAIGGGEGAIRMFGGATQALGAQQLHQQRGAGGIEGAEAIEVDGVLSSYWPSEFFAQAA